MKINEKAAAQLPEPQTATDYKNVLLKDTRVDRVLGFQFDGATPLMYRKPSLRAKAEINRLAGVTAEGVQPGAEYKLLMLSVIHSVYAAGKPVFEVSDLDAMLDLPEDSPVVQVAMEVASIMQEEAQAIADVTAKLQPSKKKR